MTDKNLGHATAYGYAKSKGYTGTEEEFAELMASYADVAESAKGYAEQAEASASNASTSETNARASASTASTKASEASTSASNAQTSASNAQASAASAGTSASSASASAQTASTKASEASDSATSASESASTAVSAKDDAVKAKEQAETAKADAETAAEEAQESAQTVANKADKDGTYPDMTVGNVFSDDSYTEDQTPYLYRVSGGGVEVGKIETDKIVGGTVAWNQLVQNGNFADTSGWSSTRGTLSVSNSIVSYTSTEIGGGALKNRLEGLLPVIPKGHRVMFIATAKPAHTTTFRCQVRAGTGGAMAPLKTVNNVTGGAWIEISGINSFDNDISGGYSQIWLSFEETSSNGYVVGDVDQFKNVQLFDLTQMFGSNIADMIYNREQSSTGAGVAFFRSLFPNDYYDYNVGELKSVEGLQSHDMVGFNQWDEEVELGNIDGGTGQGTVSTTRLRAKNYLPVIGGGTYYYRCPGSSPITLCYYDADKSFISGTYKNVNNTFVVPSNAQYLRINLPNDYGTTYKNDICINISSDCNGEYEPYIKHSYPLDSSLTLRGIPKVADGKMCYDGDEYSADGKVQRKYGIRAYQSGDESLTDAITDGTNTVYMLSTPTEETAQPYTEYQKVSKYGTEEYVSTSIVPVGHDTKYPTDIVSKVDGLPSDFSTLIAPTEKGFTATRAYTVNDLIIVSNQLYRATTSIASGATLTVGTNVVATTIASLIKGLL